MPDQYPVDDADPLAYYAGHGVMTDPREYRGLLDDLPTDTGDLIGLVQGIMVHLHWAGAYGLSLSDQRRAEASLRSVPRILRRVLELDARPLSSPRPVEQRVVGTCRDFSVLLCALLRHQGVPARARCGFGRYFLRDHFEDHWICQYWDRARTRWVMVDAQLDALQRDALGITFDVLDVPSDQFVVGGRAWQLARSGQADPDQFGIDDMHGLSFIGGNVVRDVLALNRIEILPWDDWDLTTCPSQPVPESDLPLLDRTADLIAGTDPTWADVRALFDAEPRLHTFPDWLSEDGQPGAEDPV